MALALNDIDKGPVEETAAEVRAAGATCLVSGHSTVELDAARALIALGRYGRPEDLANAHLFLASQEADYITGIVLPAAGGLLGV